MARKVWWKQTHLTTDNSNYIDESTPHAHPNGFPSISTFLFQTHTLRASVAAIFVALLFFVRVSRNSHIFCVSIQKFALGALLLCSFTFSHHEFYIFLASVFIFSKKRQLFCSGRYVLVNNNQADTLIKVQCSRHMCAILCTQSRIGVLYASPTIRSMTLCHQQSTRHYKSIAITLDYRLGWKLFYWP